MINRVLICLPIFVAAFFLLQINFDIIWRYFAWANQTLAVFTLWAVTVYLFRSKKNFYVTLLPAMFMTAVSVSYIALAREGFSLSRELSYGLGVGFSLALLIVFVVYAKKQVRRGEMIEVEKVK